MKSLTPCVRIPSMPTTPVLRKVCAVDNMVLCSPHPVVTSNIKWFHNNFLFFCSRLQTIGLSFGRSQ